MVVRKGLTEAPELALHSLGRRAKRLGFSHGPTSEARVVWVVGAPLELAGLSSRSAHGNPPSTTLDQAVMKAGGVKEAKVGRSQGAESLLGGGFFSLRRALATVTGPHPVCRELACPVIKSAVCCQAKLAVTSLPSVDYFSIKGI